MPVKTLVRLLLLSFAIALLHAGLFFNGSRAAPALPADVTPTRDRLVQPTLPASPSQADYGAQVYWLSCLPCHGDFGQGLTDEFRQVYPPEDRNCWASGCHGERPYENGFKLPAGIPALVGADTLQKFPNAAVLQAYTKATMPYWKPGSLSDEDAWAVTAFLLRENGLWNARTELNVSNADQAPVRALEAESTPEPPPSASPSATWIRLILILAGALMLFILLRQIRSRKNPRV